MLNIRPCVPLGLSVFKFVLLFFFLIYQIDENNLAEGFVMRTMCMKSDEV